jgi:signal transduction histidine kinase
MPTGLDPAVGPLAGTVGESRTSRRSPDGADPARGSGLRGLADRVSSLDGQLDVESPPGRGTTISAHIPCA